MVLELRTESLKPHFLHLLWVKYMYLVAGTPTSHVSIIFPSEFFLERVSVMIACF